MQTDTCSVDQLLAQLRERLRRPTDRAEVVAAIRRMILEAANDPALPPSAPDGLLRNSPLLQTIIDNMPSGVTLFGPDLAMIACNERAKRLLDFPDHLFTDGLPSFDVLARFNAGRGEYGDGDPDTLAAPVVERARRMQPHRLERTRPDGTVLEIRGVPLPGGGFVSIYTDITDRRNAEAAARRYATYLHSVLHSLPQGVSVVDEDLNIVLWNQAFVEILGLPENFLATPRRFDDVIRLNAERGDYGPGEVEEQVRMRVARVRRFQAYRFERTRLNGRVLDVDSRPMRTEERIVGLTLTFADITERKRAEEAVRRARDLMFEAMSCAPIYVWETDAEGRFTFVEGAEKILGYAPEEMIGRPFSDFSAEEPTPSGHSLPLPRAVAACLPFRNDLVRCRGKHGRLVWVSSSGHPRHDDDGHFQGYRGVDVDVTELTTARRELEWIAHHDMLTGLANRHKFLARFDHERERQRRSARPLSLLAVDIDHFKKVNDQYGHRGGDACLKRVATALSDSVRATDLVARFGGEEFVALMPELDLDDATILAERLRRAVAEDTGYAQDLGRTGPTAITVSIGVAVSPPDSPLGFEDLMEQADQALYQAKRTGRNRVCRYDIETTTPFVRHQPRSGAEAPVLVPVDAD